MFVSFKLLYLRNYGNIGVDRFNGCKLQWMVDFLSSLLVCMCYFL
jgi:hypothetical protein